MFPLANSVEGRDTFPLKPHAMPVISSVSGGSREVRIPLIGLLFDAGMMSLETVGSALGCPGLFPPATTLERGGASPNRGGCPHTVSEEFGMIHIANK